MNMVVGSQLSVQGASSSRRRVTCNRQPTTDNLRRLVAAVAIVLIAPIAFACPVCFGGSPNDPMVKGVNNGIWVLLALVALVQVGFAAMFWSFWRRAREHKRFRDSLRVIHSYDREGPFS